MPDDIAIQTHRLAGSTARVAAQSDIAGEIARYIAAIGRIQAVPTILQTVTHVTGMRFAAVARVTETTWTACAVRDGIAFGLVPGSELALETTICNEIRHHRQPVVFGQASAHPEFATHHTPALYGFESYISVPILLEDGSFFGTLCAIDPLPAKLDDPHVLQTLQLFAQLIGMQLDMEERLCNADRALSASIDMARVREEFIAMLSHDLRNPLQAITVGAYLLQQDDLTPDARITVDNIRGSADRMFDMIRDLLDLTRGRLGGGIPVSARVDDALAATLRQVLEETRIAHPGRELDDAIVLDAAVRCDRARVGQLLDNLLANALRHGAPDRPVRVQAGTGDGRFVLTVHNHGAPIPAARIAQLFQPFAREGSDAMAPGLGLGLYIAAEIARAHHGTLSVVSDQTGTRFTFDMPLA